MSFTHLILKCIYLLSALFMSAALLPGVIESRLTGDLTTMSAPIAGVAIYIAVGFITLVLLRKTVFNVNFSGENCIIKTCARVYTLPLTSFTSIKKGIADFVFIRCRDGKRTRRFILRGSRIKHYSAVEEMRRRFPNAVFSV